MKEELYGLANHIAGAKGGLPQEWQDWASEIEMDIRKLANREAHPVGYFVRHRSAWDRPSKWRLWTECSAEDYAEFLKIIATGDADAGRFYEARILYDAPSAPANAQPVLYASEETLAYAKEGEKSLVTWSEPIGDAVIPLFTVQKAQTSGVVNLPTEFISDEGVMVRLEQVMAALAVVGVKCERKSNAKTRCEFPSSEVPEEMTGGIAMSKYKVKKSNYAQWVKGWNACRAAMLNHVGETNEKAAEKCECSSIDYCDNCLRAMLAQPVSGGYKLPDGFKLMPLEMTDEIGEAIAMEARCCGGIALCIYEAALAAAPGES